MTSSDANDPLITKMRALHVRLKGPARAVRMWHELMTEADRRELGRLVQAEPLQVGLDDRSDFGNFSLTDEYTKGSPGNLLHRCYFRWGIVGMWARSRSRSTRRALLELAHEFGFIRDVEYRRLANHTLGNDFERPNWCAEAGELKFQGEVVRQVAAPDRSKNLRLVLDAFQEESWPRRVDDPLPAGEDKQRLRETVRNLNRRLSKIQFLSDGSGVGIVWQIDTRATHAREP